MSAPKSDQFDIWKAIQPQVVIVNNPMYFVQLRRETKSKLVWFFDHFKSFTERWFSHILLLMSLFLYGCFGAWIFMMIEGQAEIKYKEPISNMVEDFKREFWYQSHVMKRNKTAISKLIELRMGEFERQLLENFNAGIIGNIDQVAWTFWDALFFCVTIFTTIGYGHVTLKTDLGRGFTMIYAFIGIPLVLMVLTDLGKLFTRAIKATFLAIRRFLYAHGFRKVKSASRRVAPTQYVTNVMSTIRRLSHVPLMGKRNGSGDDKEKLNPDGDKNNNNNNNRNTNPTFKSTTLNIELPFANSKPVEPVDQLTVVKDPPKNQPTKIYKTPAIFASEKKGPIFPGPPPPTVIISTNPTPPMTAYVESRPGSPITPETPAPFAVDDEFNLPVSLALFILVLYILIGSFIFTHTDNWRLFESFYFVYISMSTIGFGDYVPKSSVSMIASSVYLLFGLALTSMCINVIQERLSESFEKAKVSLGAQLGFDMNQAPPIGQPHVDPAPKHEAGKQVGFELKPNNIGQSLRERRERRKSSERSTPSDKNSDRSSNGDSDRLSQALSELESIKIPDDDEKSRSPSPIKYSDL